jgi:hypothetical protein
MVRDSSDHKDDMNALLDVRAVSLLERWMRAVASAGSHESSNDLVKEIGWNEARLKRAKFRPASTNAKKFIEKHNPLLGIMDYRKLDLYLAKLHVAGKSTNLPRFSKFLEALESVDSSDFIAEMEKSLNKVPPEAQPLVIRLLAAFRFKKSEERTTAAKYAVAILLSTKTLMNAEYDKVVALALAAPVPANPVASPALAAPAPAKSADPETATKAVASLALVAPAPTNPADPDTATMPIVGLALATPVPANTADPGAETKLIVALALAAPVPAKPVDPDLATKLVIVPAPHALRSDGDNS